MNEKRDVSFDGVDVRRMAKETGIPVDAIRRAFEVFDEQHLKKLLAGAETIPDVWAVWRQTSSSTDVRRSAEDKLLRLVMDFFDGDHGAEETTGLFPYLPPGHIHEYFLNAVVGRFPRRRDMLTLVARRAPEGSALQERALRKLATLYPKRRGDEGKAEKN